MIELIHMFTCHKLLLILGLIPSLENLATESSRFHSQLDLSETLSGFWTTQKPDSRINITDRNYS